MKCNVSSNVLPTPEMRLFHSRKKCKRFLEKHGIPFETDMIMDAMTWAFEDDGVAYAVVLYDSGIRTDYIDDIAILAHESTHVALFTFGSIGEEEPAEEEMCYMVQAVLWELAKAHFDWKEKKIEGCGNIHQ